MRPLIWLLVILFSGVGPVRAQFGKNKVQYRHIQWQYIQTPHFDIYYGKGAFPLARFAAQVADSAYGLLKTSYNYELPEGERISIIVHRSHNEFESTNVSPEQPSEGVGGFTEFYHDRVVVPFQGSWEDFRHVIHHELSHAVMLKMIFGSRILAGISRFQLPLWFIEGLAEYESRGGWDRDANMFLADAVLNDYLYSFDNMNGLLAYKAGQAFFCYLEERYGREKVGELLNRLRTMRNFPLALEHSLGAAPDELFERWIHYLQKAYWPIIRDRQRAEDIGQRLTDHLQLRNFINNSPTISPGGDRVAFLTDRNGYFDVYLMNLRDYEHPKLLLSGQKSGRFEELHWLRPGLSWSPDGEKLVLTSKSGDKDVLHLLDVRRRKVVRNRRFPGDGAWSPSWSPDGRRIAFVGLADNRTDIWYWDLESDSLVNVTNDVFTDLDPAWSPDSRRLAFVSDRGDSPPGVRREVPLDPRDYDNLDLQVLDIDSGECRRITRTPYGERTPLWLSRNELLHIADEGGAYNLYYCAPDSLPEPRPLTNLLTGILQPSYSPRSGKLVFSAYQKAGYDIFLVESAAALLADSTNLVVEDFYPFRQVGQQPPLGTPTLMVYGTGGDTGLEHFDFTTLRSSREKQTTGDSLRYLDADQQYLRHPYKVRFSVDAMQAQAVYSQYFGVQGASELLFSDLLGNHRIHLSLDLYGKIKLTNYSLYYQYLARRPELQLGIHRRIYYFATSQDTIFRDNYFGGLVQLNFPVNRYLRVELQQRLTGVDRSFTTGELDADQYYIYHALELDRFLVPQLRLVYDNVIWGSTGPENGFRGYVGARWSFPFSFPGAGRNFGVNFQTLTFDLRRYLRLSRDYQFALRLGGGFSLGDSPQRFFLGGERNWINYRLAPVGRERARILTSMDRIYLSEFVFPVRGSRYYERIGDSYALGNLEFRFPLLHYLLLGWPTQLGFSNVRGALFLDLGSAWYGRDFHGLRRTEEGRLVLDDLLLGYGWGARFHLGYFLIKMDAAWRSDLDGSPGKPFYSFSLGAEL